jgi:membrane protein implicated in regulation of membrane protease activity
MNRVWDYIVFAVWFAGLGYIVVWLGGSPVHLMLPPALHAVGVAAATLVPVRLLVRAVGRRRRPAPGVVARKPAAVLRPPRRKSSHPIRQVKPRSHFGLRGMPR